jgi:hypothetical protein
MSAEEWLDKKEWENVDVTSSAYPHYTKLDRVMEEYAKHYLKEHLNHLITKQRENDFI